MGIDFCQYVRDIANDPTAIPPQLTVAQFLKLRQHVLTCEECTKLVDVVLESAPSHNLDDVFNEN